MKNLKYHQKFQISVEMLRKNVSAIRNVGAVACASSLETFKHLRVLRNIKNYFKGPFVKGGLGKTAVDRQEKMQVGLKLLP
jgi:hypothetical protein